MRRLPTRPGIIGALSRWIGIASFTLTSMLSAGCASQSYMGIPLMQGQAPADIQELARRAHAGDKQAQLKLGMAYEEGRGITRDLQNACSLYRLSAADNSESYWIYTPSPGGGAPARVIGLKRPIIPGLREAKKKYEHLNNKEKCHE